MNPKSAKNTTTPVTPPEKPLVTIEPAAKEMQPNQVVTFKDDMFVDKFRAKACKEGSDESAFLFAKKGHTMHFSSLSGISGHEPFITA